MKSIGHNSYLHTQANPKFQDAFSSIYSDPSNIDDEEFEVFSTCKTIDDQNNQLLLSGQKNRQKKTFNPIALVSKPQCCLGDGPVR